MEGVGYCVWPGAHICATLLLYVLFIHVVVTSRHGEGRVDERGIRWKRNELAFEKKKGMAETGKKRWNSHLLFFKFFLFAA